MSDLTKKSKAGALAPASTLSAWSDGAPTISKNDLIISKVLLMQGMSKLVTEGSARMGEIRDSVTGEMLADVGQTLEIVPFLCKKFWVQFSKGEKALEYAGKVEVVDNPSDPYYNADWDWETPEGRNDYAYEFFVLVPGETMPKIVSFRRTGLKAGKKMFNQMYILNREKDLPPPGYKMKLSGRKVVSDEGTYMVWDVERGDLTSTEELAGAFKVYQQITKGMQSGSVKVDDSDLEDVK